MSAHNSYESTKRFSMGTLLGNERVEFKRHLRECYDCRDALRRINHVLHGSHQGHDEELAGTFAGSNAVYHLVQIILRKASLKNIGILLTAGSERLYYRFRRDVKQIAPGQEDWLMPLPDLIDAKANELGAQRCLQWLESTYSGRLRISPGKTVLIEDSATITVDRLYGEYLQPTVLPFVTHSPSIQPGSSSR